MDGELAIKSRKWRPCIRADSVSYTHLDVYKRQILHLAGTPRRYVFQGVHMLHDGEMGAPWREGERRTNRMVFICRNLDRAAMESSFRDCLVGQP